MEEREGIVVGKIWICLLESLYLPSKLAMVKIKKKDRINDKKNGD